MDLRYQCLSYRKRISAIVITFNSNQPVLQNSLTTKKCGKHVKTYKSTILYKASSIFDKQRFCFKTGCPEKKYIMWPHFYYCETFLIRQNISTTAEHFYYRRAFLQLRRVKIISSSVHTTEWRETWRLFWRIVVIFCKRLKTRSWTLGVEEISMYFLP